MPSETTLARKASVVDFFLATAHQILVTGSSQLRGAGRTISLTCGEVD
jgi:hypothetical protein